MLSRQEHTHELINGNGGYQCYHLGDGNKVLHLPVNPVSVLAEYQLTQKHLCDDATSLMARLARVAWDSRTKIRVRSTEYVGLRLTQLGDEPCPFCPLAVA